jgi:hypothetical protein
MQLKQLINTLLKIQSDKDCSDIEVEMFDPHQDATYTLDKIRFVEEYDFSNASKTAPTILIHVSE